MRGRWLRPGHGFTLVELVVASVIGALLAGSTVVAVSQLLRARERSAARQQAYGRAEVAAALIALDAANAVRDHELRFVKVAVLDSGDGAEARDEVLMLARLGRRARPGGDGPEGDEYEIHYRVAPLISEPGMSALWRRVDPALDQALDAGGVASAVVAGVVGLDIAASDGQVWFPSWDSDRDGMPHALRITVQARSDDGRVSAVIRRVVAFDRVPVPAQEQAETAPASPARARTRETAPAGDEATPSPVPPGSGGRGGGDGRSGSGAGGGFREGTRQGTGGTQP